MYNVDMNQQETDEFKDLLLKEKKQLEEELGHVAQKNTNINDAWEPIPKESDTVVADKNDVADRLEDFGERQSIENTLNKRLHQVQKALQKIELGTYGICEISGDKIPPERLKANPSATTKAQYAK